MRDDLLDPYACVDWSVSQLDVFSKRIAAWIDSRPYTVTRKKNPQPGEEGWEIDEVEPIPRVINAQAGVIINSLRSGLDVLANKLAERNNHFGKKDVYLPICLTFAEFDRKRGGREKIKRLSAADQKTIESLQPYHGGDRGELLWYLHDLDVTRKHRRLLEAHSSPHGLGIMRYASLPPEFDELLRKQPPDDGYVFPRGPADPDHHIQIRIEVALNYPGPLANEPIITALLKLAAAAKSVIGLFDN